MCGQCHSYIQRGCYSDTWTHTNKASRSGHRHMGGTNISTSHSKGKCTACAVSYFPLCRPSNGCAWVCGLHQVRFSRAQDSTHHRCCACGRCPGLGLRRLKRRTAPQELFSLQGCIGSLQGCIGFRLPGDCQLCVQAGWTLSILMQLTRPAMMLKKPPPPPMPYTGVKEGNSEMPPPYP